MKVNKKIVVPFLSAVIGLSVSGGIGGAFAWYQYNSQVTASFIGTSVADTSVLQIGHIDSGTDITWRRDYAFNDNAHKARLIPVTFGQLGTGNVLGTQAYGYPEAGKQANSGYTSWSKINPNDGYVQFDIYLQALKTDHTAVALDVFLSDITIQAVRNEVVDNTETILDAVRIHLAVDGEANPNRLISKTAITSPLNLYGPLDLDGDGVNDKIGGYSWEYDNTEIVYGINGETQTTVGVTDVVQARDENGLMPQSGDTGYAKKICTTSASLGSPLKITVTTWLEGWALQNIGDTNGDSVNESSNLWDSAYSAGVDVRVGLRFDTGKVRLSQSATSSEATTEESTTAESTTE